MVLPYNPSTWEAEVGGWGVQGQSWLHSEILSQRKQNKTQAKSKLSLEVLSGLAINQMPLL